MAPLPCSCPAGGGTRDASHTPRPPPTQDPKRPEALTFRRRGAVIGDSPWLGPQTLLEGGPLALMQAGAEGHRSFRCSGRGPTVRATERPTEKLSSNRRCAYKGSLRGPTRKPANGPTLSSGQLSLAATRAPEGLSGPDGPRRTRRGLGALGIIRTGMYPWRRFATPEPSRRTTRVELRGVPGRIAAPPLPGGGRGADRSA